MGLKHQLCLMRGPILAAGRGRLAQTRSSAVGDRRPVVQGPPVLSFLVCLILNNLIKWETQSVCGTGPISGAQVAQNTGCSASVLGSSIFASRSPTQPRLGTSPCPKFRVELRRTSGVWAGSPDGVSAREEWPGVWGGRGAWAPSVLCLNLTSEFLTSAQTRQLVPGCVQCFFTVAGKDT